MNRNQEAFEKPEELDCIECRFLKWLQTDSRSSGTQNFSVPAEDGVISSGFAKSSCDDSATEEVEDLDPLLSEELDCLPMSDFGSDCGSSDASGHLVSDVEQLLRPGDTPMIEERSQTILKSRLRNEIEHHPPLFPWETEIVDYEPETIDFPMGSVVPSIFGHQYSGGIHGGISFWTPQLPKMNGCKPMPQEVLAQLLEQCNQAIKSNLREWAKLVDVVEQSLFPGRFRELNEMATRLSIAGQHRSAMTTDIGLMPRTGEFDSPIAYDVATPTQQMLMSLLAAREIIGNLTLDLSSSQPKLERQWLTAVGLLSLELEYQQASVEGYSVLKVCASLPCGGKVSLTGGQSQTRSQRSNPGGLTVELSNLDVQQNYLLEVHLDSSEENSLTFAVCLHK
jgi:hypothetical protein